MIDAGQVQLSICPHCGRHLTWFESDYNICWDCEDAAAHYQQQRLKGWQEVKNIGIVIDGTYSVDWGTCQTTVTVIGFGDKNPAWVKVEEVQPDRVLIYLVAVNLLKPSTPVALEIAS